MQCKTHSACRKNCSVPTVPVAREEVSHKTSFLFWLNSTTKQSARWIILCWSRCRCLFSLIFMVCVLGWKLRQISSFWHISLSPSLLIYFPLTSLPIFIFLPLHPFPANLISSHHVWSLLCHWVWFLSPQTLLFFFLSSPSFYSYQCLPWRDIWGYLLPVEGGGRMGGEPAHHNIPASLRQISQRSDFSREPQNDYSKWKRTWGTNCNLVEGSDILVWLAGWTVTSNI